MCWQAPRALLQEYLDLGPAALHFAYQKEADVQRGLAMRGHALILAEESEAKEQARRFSLTMP